MRKLLSAILILLLISGLTFVLAENESTVYTSGDYKYILLKNGTAEITDYNGTAISLTIPETIDGYAVTAIGDYAFSNCDSLTTIFIVDSVTAIGSNPFPDCDKLTDIIVSPDHPVLAIIDGVLFDKTEKNLICYPVAYTNRNYEIPQGIRSIGDSAFYSCKSLTTISIPDSVIFIEGDAFSNCEFLTTISIPNSVTTIGGHAFGWCSSLTTIFIPDSVTVIGNGAFSNCKSLSTVSIPDSVTFVGENPFFGCEKLTDIVVSPDHPMLATIDGVLFDKTEKKLICYPMAYTNSSYAIPQGIRSIGDSAFYFCDSLTNIFIPDSITAIGDDAFTNCGSLTSITIPSSVTTIGNRAFLFCGSLSSITIPSSITTIGSHAFLFCGSLSSITIPNSVTYIGDSAFLLCSPLNIITVPRNSYAAQYCKENGLRYTYPDANDWLLN